jgi:DNA-binding CsgD family transcriptional regulator
LLRARTSALKLQHYNAAARFICEASAARDFEQFVAFVLSELPKLVSSEMTSYNEINVREGRSNDWVNPVQPPERNEAWVRVMHQHPIVALAQRQHLDSTLRLSDFMTPRQLRNTALYAEHYGPIGGMLDCLPILWSDNGNVNAIGVHRMGRFSDSEQALMNVVSQHLVQAHANTKAISALERSLACLEEVVEAANHAAIFLKPDRAIAFATTRALEWASEYFGSAAPDRLPEKLELWVRHHDEALQQLLELPRPRDPLIVERCDRRLLVRLLSSQNGSIVILHEQTLSISPEALKSLGLSARENAVLALVANGLSNAEIACALGISTRTVEAHVFRICDELGVKTRTAAAALAFRVSRIGEQACGLQKIEAEETRVCLRRVRS